MLSRLDRAVMRVPALSRLINDLAVALLPQRVAHAGCPCPPTGVLCAWRNGMCCANSNAWNWAVDSMHCQTGTAEGGCCDCSSCLF